MLGVNLEGNRAGMMMMISTTFLGSPSLSNILMKVGDSTVHTPHVEYACT